jgi:hypothetical protein
VFLYDLGESFFDVAYALLALRHVCGERDALVAHYIVEEDVEPSQSRRAVVSDAQDLARDPA